MTSKLPGLFRRGGAYCVRIVLPKDHPLRHQHACGRIVQSLGHCSHREAVTCGLARRAALLAPLGVEPGGQGPVAAPAPSPPAPRTGSDENRPLRDVFERWSVAKRRPADTVAACRRALQHFEARTGNPPIRELTPGQGDAFRARLLAQKITTKTAHDRFM